MFLQIPKIVFETKNVFRSLQLPWRMWHYFRTFIRVWCGGKTSDMMTMLNLQQHKKVISPSTYSQMLQHMVVHFCSCRSMVQLCI